MQVEDGFVDVAVEGVGGEVGEGGDVGPVVVLVRGVGAEVSVGAHVGPAEDSGAACVEVVGWGGGRVGGEGAFGEGVGGGEVVGGVCCVCWRGG